MGVFELPEGYGVIKTIDLQKNKKQMLLVNALAAIIFAALIFCGYFISPFSLSEIMGYIKNSLGLCCIWFLIMLVATILYMIGHELTHGFFFKKYSGKKARYGFTGMYAYAHSDAFFPRKPYLIIGLAPVILFGVLFLLLNLFLPSIWFWPIYWLQIVNLSGAAGDAYVTIALSRMPADILVYDEGTAMAIYSRENISADINA